MNRQQYRLWKEQEETKWFFLQLEEEVSIQLEEVKRSLVYESAELTHSRLSYSKGAYDALEKVLELQPERLDDDDTD